MELGNKLKNARMSASYTQEQAAELLGVSRQTISNWENDKTYPDIVSVIKMSDAYDISLDLLLKEEQKMSNYVTYLEESTNVVKSKKRLLKLIEMGIYLAVWSLAMLMFWFATQPDDAMGYSLLVFYLVLPVTTLNVSLFIGLDSGWGKGKWLMPLFFGVMYMLAEYGTFSLANMRAFDKFNVPEFGMIIPGVVISLIGMGIGSAIGYFSGRKVENNIRK